MYFFNLRPILLKRLFFEWSRTITNNAFNELEVTVEAHQQQKNGNVFTQVEVEISFLNFRHFFLHS